MEPKITSKELNMCSLPQWYDILGRYTFPTKFITLPSHCIEYLLADSIYVPGMHGKTNNKYNVESDSDSVSEDSNLPEFQLEEVEEDIRHAIRELGGAVFPKLNWSSPKDASWIAFGNTLRCESPSDVLLLLKSSNFISHDLKYAYEQCSGEVEKMPITLCLRQWASINPTTEFRCVVRNNAITCVSQRNINCYFPAIQEKAEQFLHIILEYFDSLPVIGLGSFIFDVHIHNGKPILIDINPFSKVTDSLLFDWSEILEIAEPTIRIVRSEAETSKNPDYIHNMLPREAFDFSESGNIAEFIEKFNSEIRNQFIK